MSQLPEGFLPFPRNSAFSDLVGPFYYKPRGESLSVGMRAEEKHANMRGIIHGGVLATLVDVALGFTSAFTSDPPRGYVTAHLSIDYAGRAHVGDWLDARVDIQKRGNRLAFANCFVWVGEKRIVHASAVFATAARIT